MKEDLAQKEGLELSLRRKTKLLKVTRSKFYYQAKSRTNEDEIHRLVDGAEQLAQMLQNDSHSCVLCHSDIHAGNVLIDQSNAIYIVDWDAPIMAPKERDLMFIGGDF